MASAFSRQMWNSKTVSVLPAPREIAGRSMDGNFSAGKVLAVRIRNSRLERKEHGI